MQSEIHEGSAMVRQSEVRTWVDNMSSVPCRIYPATGGLCIAIIGVTRLEREGTVDRPSFWFPSKNRNLLPHAYLEIAGRLKQRPRRLAQLHIAELIRRLPIARVFRS